MSTEQYFDPAYRESRKKVTAELREIAEGELPQPQENWEVIWVLSGPEEKFDDPPSEGGKYNQNKVRFETAFDLMKQVTALRLQKDITEVTADDVRQSGPSLYYNSLLGHNEYITELRKQGVLERKYTIPSEKIVISPTTTIQHTGHQFEDAPVDMVGENDQLVIVSDLYHLPRVKRYAEGIKDKISPEHIVLYPAQPQSLPLRATLREIKKMYPYQQRGLLPHDKE